MKYFPQKKNFKRFWKEYSVHVEIAKVGYGNTSSLTGEKLVYNYVGWFSKIEDSPNGYQCNS